MSPANQNKALVRTYIDGAWNQGDAQVVERLLGEHFKCYDPATRHKPRGRAGVRQMIEEYRTAFPDLHVTIEEQVAEGDCVVTRWTACGTHLGRLRAIPGTSRRLALVGLSLHRLGGGHLLQEWTSFDALGVIQLLWALPIQSSERAAA